MVSRCSQLDSHVVELSIIVGCNWVEVTEDVRNAAADDEGEARDGETPTNWANDQADAESLTCKFADKRSAYVVRSGIRLRLELDEALRADDFVYADNEVTLRVPVVQQLVANRHR